MKILPPIVVFFVSWVVSKGNVDVFTVVLIEIIILTSQVEKILLLLPKISVASLVWINLVWPAT